jgi:preprotein translocase subunit SecF
MGFAHFGNELYNGRRSLRFIGRRKIWYMIATLSMVIAIVALLTLKLNPGIEFRGGSQFEIKNASSTSQTLGEDAVHQVSPASEALVTKLGTNGVRVQTDKLNNKTTDQVAAALATAYKVPANSITSSFVGPSWGRDISKKAIQGLVVFLILVALVIAAYFRTWKMAAAGLAALIHDLLLTVGVYALTGFEVTPATVIGFLTILGYSLYDTVVVFDKVRENTDDITHSNRRTFEEAANLAINQTLVRSINTSVVALLPVGSILFIGSFVLGAGTLKDISLALFVGIAAGTYSSIFIATPLLVDLRRREPEIVAHTAKILRRRAEAAAKAQATPVTPIEDDDADLDAVGAGVAPAGAGSSPGGRSATGGASGAGAGANAGTGSKAGAGSKATAASGSAAARASGQGGQSQRRQPKRNGKSRPGSSPRR